MCHLWDNLEKHSRARQVIDENMVVMHCILGTQGHSYTYMVIAFPQQQWLSSVLHSIYIVCLVQTRY
jgi:hypothetical protein